MARRPEAFLPENKFRASANSWSSGESSRPGPNPRGKRCRRRRRACVLRRPARIAHRVPAQRRQIVNHVSQDDRSVKRLRVNQEALRRSHLQSLSGERAGGDSADPAGACSGEKSVVPRAGGGTYNARDRGQTGNTSKFVLTKILRRNMKQSQMGCLNLPADIKTT